MPALLKVGYFLESVVKNLYKINNYSEAAS